MRPVEERFKRSVKANEARKAEKNVRWEEMEKSKIYRERNFEVGISKKRKWVKKGIIGRLQMR